MRLHGYFPNGGKNWTATKPLPGGDIHDLDFKRWIEEKYRRYHFLPQPVVEHYGKLYGTRIGDLLKGVFTPEDLGEHFGKNLYAIEADYLKKKEWAQTAEDILERRTKHGLHLSDAQKKQFSAYFN